MSDTECDRLWSALDKANQYMEGLEERVLKLETTRPARSVGDYFPDPASDDLRQQLDQVRAILGDFLEPAGIPSPAQRIVLRIREVVGAKDSVVERNKGRDE